MEWALICRQQAAGTEMEAAAAWMGGDVLLCLRGGDRPHIGCTVQAVPRPSLKDPGRTSATSSVLNLPGHKDEALCRLLAEQVCAALGCVTVCTGGVHLDHISPEQIDALLCGARTLAFRVAEGLKAQQGRCVSRAERV